MIWGLALQSLRLRPVRTFLTALGIAIAVASTVIFLSLGEGLRQIFAEELGGNGPAIQVSFGPFETNKLGAIPNLPLSYAAKIAAQGAPLGVTAVTPILLYVRSGVTPANAFVFQGIPPSVPATELLSGFKVLAGRALKASDQHRNVAVVGKQVAENNHLALGDTLRLGPESRYEIVGIAQSDGSLASFTILVPLPALQKSIGISKRVSFFALSLKEPAKAASVAATLGKRFADLSFQTQAQILRVLERGIRITDVVRLGISMIALIVGAIAVANTMLISVFERTREFGVIRALGARARFLFGLVLCEAVLLSLGGALVGLLLGRAGIAVVNHIANDLVGLKVALLTLRLALFAVSVALVMGLLSGLLPAARAARIPIAVAMARE